MGWKRALGGFGKGARVGCLLECVWTEMGALVRVLVGVACGG